MNYAIRECVLADADHIYELNRTEMEYDYSVIETRQKIEELLCSQHDKIYVAVVDGNIVGYVHANDYNLIYAPAMKNIMGIAVSGQYKRMGIGKALLDTVEKWAKADGVKGVRLVSGINRKEAHTFYMQCGYIEGKEQLNFKKYFTEDEGDSIS